YNALEEAIWASVFAEEDGPDRYRTVLPWVSASIGAAKDELARDYVRLAAGDHAPSVDVTALFRGGTRPRRTTEPTCVGSLQPMKSACDARCLGRGAARTVCGRPSTRIVAAPAPISRSQSWTSCSTEAT